MRTAVQQQNEDPFFFDREGLESIASAQAVGEGLRYFKQHRVLAVDQDRERLWAQVENEGQELPCDVMMVSQGDLLLLECDCAESGTEVCRHTVATLYAYADQKESGDQLLSVADSAIKDRVKRGRTEVVVDSVGFVQDVES